LFIIDGLIIPLQSEMSHSHPEPVASVKLLLSSFHPL